MRNTNPTFTASDGGPRLSMLLPAGELHPCQGTLLHAANGRAEAAAAPSVNRAIFPKFQCSTSAHRDQGHC